MTLALSLVRDALDGWIIVTIGLLVLLIWQRRIRYGGPPVLSIEPDEAQMKKQKAFIRKTDRMRQFVLCFATASAAFALAIVVAWLYTNVK